MDTFDNSKFLNLNKIIKYPPNNSSKGFESYFYEKYMENNIETGLKYLPIQWTNYYVENNYGEDLKEIKDYLEQNLEKNNKYFTITQLAGGPLISLKDTVVFSMGGMFRTPLNPNLSYIYLPLIYKDMKKTFKKNKKYLGSYQGRLTHPIRKTLERKLKRKDGFFINNLNTMSSDFEKNNIDDFETLISDSYFSICPRGFGPTSFRLYESIGLGSVPVYVSDTFVLPFSEIIDWSKLAVIIKPNEINKIPKIINEILNSNKYVEMLEYGSYCFENYFNFSYLDQYIRKVLKNFK